MQVLIFFKESFSLSLKYVFFFYVSSDDEQRVSVRAEHVIAFESELVCLHYIFVTSERCHRHEHGRARTVEVRDDRIRNSESVWREDELVCPSVICVHLVVGCDICLK